MNSHKMFEGNSKGFKNWPICAKHAIFAIESSRMQVAKASRQNTQKNFEKFFLNVFRDWKFYLRESCKVSRENLWVPSWLEPPPANKSQD